MERMILTASEAAEVLAIDKSKVLKLLAEGEIMAFREGRNWKIPVRLLEEYIEQRAIVETEGRRINHECITEGIRHGVQRADIQTKNKR